MSTGSIYLIDWAPGTVTIYFPEDMPPYMWWSIIGQAWFHEMFESLGEEVEC